MTNIIIIHRFRERTDKVRTKDGAKPSDYRITVPSLFAVPDDPFCTVKMYKKYASKRPSNFNDPSHPFFLSINTFAKHPSDNWYKCQAMGVNKISSILKTMVAKAGITGE